MDTDVGRMFVRNGARPSGLECPSRGSRPAGIHSLGVRSERSGAFFEVARPAATVAVRRGLHEENESRLAQGQAAGFIRAHRGRAGGSGDALTCCVTLHHTA
jgi:hypothetical protein